MSKLNTLPAPAYKPIAELADEWGITTRRILIYGATKQLEIHTLANNWSGIQGELVEHEDRDDVVPEKIGIISGLLKVSYYVLNQIQVEGSAASDLFGFDNGDYARLDSPVKLTTDNLYVVDTEQRRFTAIADSVPTTIPDYRTPLMDAMYAAITKHWLYFDKTRPPSQHVIVDWLIKEQGIKKTSAEAIDKIIRHAERKKGGNHRMKKA